MSLLDKASLIVTPNAYKASKLYSVIPSSGTGDMTVVRATTATRVNSAGLIESVAVNVPRIDYTNESCPSLLLEVQRTNLNSTSNLSGWGSLPTTIRTYNTTDLLSPDGTNNATKIQSTLITEDVSNVITVANGAVTFSFYGRVLSGTKTIQVDVRNNSGTIVTLSPTLTTQWQRFTITNLNSGTGSSGAVWFYPNSIGNIYIYGAQMEQGAYATSLIPTVASTVTRNADAISKTGISSLIGQTEGVLFIESAALANDFTSRIISISDGTLNNRIIINYSTSSNTIQLNVFSGGTAITLINYVVSDTTQFAKIAVRYSNTLGYSLWVNGVNRGSSVSTTIPASMSRLGFDNGSGGTFFVSKIKQVNLYKIALSNTEMATLTTL